MPDGKCNWKRFCLGCAAREESSAGQRGARLVQAHERSRFPFLLFNYRTQR